MDVTKSLADIKNAYTCSKCHGQVVTLNRDAGMIAMLLPCLYTENCSGFMRIAGDKCDYGRPFQYEWFEQPEPEKISDVIWRAHVKAGNLDLRRAVVGSWRIETDIVEFVRGYDKVNVAKLKQRFHQTYMTASVMLGSLIFNGVIFPTRIVRDEYLVVREVPWAGIIAL